MGKRERRDGWMEEGRERQEGRQEKGKWAPVKMKT